MIRLATAVAVCAALVFAGCGNGNEKTIPHDDGATLIRLLKQARDDAGDRSKCDSLERTIASIQARVQSLPASVDKDTRDSLTNGVSNLSDSARQECQKTQTTTTKSTPTTPPQTTPTTPSTTTPTTPPQTTPTTPSNTTPSTPTQPTTPNNGGAPGPSTAPGQQKGNGKGQKGPKDRPTGKGKGNGHGKGGKG